MAYAWAVMALKFSLAKHVLISWNQDKNQQFCGCWRPHDQSCINSFSWVHLQFAFEISGHTPFLSVFWPFWIIDIFQSGFHFALDFVSLVKSCKWYQQTQYFTSCFFSYLFLRLSRTLGLFWSWRWNYCRKPNNHKHSICVTRPQNNQSCFQWRGSHYQLQLTRFKKKNTLWFRKWSITGDSLCIVFF